MWIQAYETRNLQAVDNPFTAGQCGGMCAVWLARMLNRGGYTLAQTKPNARVATDTHLAGLRVAAPLHTPDKITGVRRLPVPEANLRYVAAAGLKPGPVKKAMRKNLGNWLAQSKASGGYFIEVGGHAVATFVNWKRFAPYEKKRRLYFFDPNHGCYYSENELGYNSAFDQLAEEHNGHNPLFQEWWWSYFKVFEVGGDEDEADIDVSSLFG